jgi:hypothetical protein
VFDLMTKWIERYRRLDEVLRSVPGGDQQQPARPPANTPRKDTTS